MDPENPVEVTPEMLSSNPLLAIVLALFSFYILCGFTGALISWGFLGWRWWQGRRLIPTWPWTARPWGLADLVFTAIAIVIVQILVGSMAVRVFDMDPKALQSGMVPMPLAAAVSGGYLLTVLLVTTWIVFRYQTSPSVLGWSTEQLPKKLLIGLIAGLASLPIVLGISALVSLGFQTEYEHPILDSIKSDGTLMTYLLALFCATIAAPVAEEFLFRVLIQGWLQSIPSSNLRQIVLGRMETVPNLATTATNNALGGFSDSGNPYAASVLPTEHQEPLEINQSRDASTTDEGQRSTFSERGGSAAPIWPSLVSGVLFGLAHWEYGLSFVPLIVLGVILGLLYRATLSIWPCIMVHFMLNASSMFAMGIGVYLEKVGGG